MKKPKRSGTGVKSAYLLDTSTLLWALGEPDLSPRARRLVEGGENVVSVASYWEVVIKTQKGLLSISDLPTWWRQATELTAARVLQIRASHITALVALPMLHKDPFDRILIAQGQGRAPGPGHGRRADPHLPDPDNLVAVGLTTGRSLNLEREPDISDAVGCGDTKGGATHSA